MSRQVCAFNPKLLLLVEQAENPLFFIEGELRKSFPKVPMEAIICDNPTKPVLNRYSIATGRKWLSTRPPINTCL